MCELYGVLSITYITLCIIRNFKNCVLITQLPARMPQGEAYGQALSLQHEESAFG